MTRLTAIIIVSGALMLLHSDESLAQRACSALESQLMQLHAGGVSRSEAGRVQMLRQRMARAGCGPGGQSARSTAKSEPSRQRGTRGRSAPSRQALRRPGKEGPQSRQAPSPGGTYRTMCVRSCDGYYFPVSFSTTREHFEDDAEVCARMCPAGDVALFFHGHGEQPADMVSLDGKPYAELPAAFRYREAFDESCSCGGPAAEDAMAEGGGAEGEAPGLRPAALPRPRVAPATDPETLANRMGGFDAASAEPEAFATAQGRFGRPVRQVGPPAEASRASELLVRPVPR